MMVIASDNCADHGQARGSDTTSHTKKSTGGKRFTDQSPAATMARIERSVTKRANGCWIWQKAKNSKGYGQIGFRDGLRANGNVRTVSKSVHRLVLEIALGEKLSVKDMACHVCDVRACCNPAHIYKGDAASNVHDMWARGRAVLPTDRKRKVAA